MDKLNRFGRLQLRYLQDSQPDLLTQIQNNSALVNHFLAARCSMEWEFEQMVFAGVEEDAAERYVIEEFFRIHDQV